MPSIVVAIQDVEWNQQIQRQVAIEDHHIPRQQGLRPVEVSEFRNQMPRSHGATHIDDDKTQTHEQRRHRDSFTDQYSLREIDVAQDVGGQDQHDRCRCQSDEKGEVGDIQSPADVVTHPRDDEAFSHLHRVAVATDQHENRQ